MVMEGLKALSRNPMEVNLLELIQDLDCYQESS